MADELSTEARSFIWDLSHPDPSQRLAISDALQHPWFRAGPTRPYCATMDELRAEIQSRKRVAEHAKEAEIRRKQRELETQRQQAEAARRQQREREQREYLLEQRKLQEQQNILAQQRLQEQKRLSTSSQENRPPQNLQDTKSVSRKNLGQRGSPVATAVVPPTQGRRSNPTTAVQPNFAKLQQMQHAQAARNRALSPMMFPQQHVPQASQTQHMSPRVVKMPAHHQHMQQPARNRALSPMMAPSSMARHLSPTPGFMPAQVPRVNHYQQTSQATRGRQMPDPLQRSADPLQKSGGVPVRGAAPTKQQSRHRSPMAGSANRAQSPMFVQG